VLRQTYHQGKTPITFEHQPGFSSAHGNRHDLLHIGDV
jgi:hypothetical protein